VLVLVLMLLLLLVQVISFSYFGHARGRANHRNEPHLNHHVGRPRS